MEVLGNVIQSLGCKVTYSKKSNVKTSLSIKALSTNFMMDRVICKQKI